MLVVPPTRASPRPPAFPCAAVGEAPAPYASEPRRQQDITSHGTASGAPSLSEATLVRLWHGQRFPASALVTRQGVPVRVLHPGRLGRGAGPDFRDAIIATPSATLLRGDVELHVKASDFFAHGHGRDGHYNRVCLHVVFEDDTDDDTRLASGVRVPVVALAPWARRRAAELATWLSAPSLWREPCHDAAERIGSDAVARTLAELGERRLREREAALARSCAERGAGETLYRALLTGLAYGSNGRLYAAVAERLPWRELAAALSGIPDRTELAEALLLGAAGLLPTQFGAAPREAREREWEARWRERNRSSPPDSFASDTYRGRPATHPARRLAGLAQLLDRHGARADGLASLEFETAGSVTQLVKRWTVQADGYWHQQIAPGLPAKRNPGALIGRGRAIELLVNAVLPWAAAVAEQAGERDDAQRAREWFARLPRPGRYGALAFLEANLRPANGPLHVDARTQQGLLVLYKSECTQGGCGRCVLS